MTRYHALPGSTSVFLAASLLVGCAKDEPAPPSSPDLDRMREADAAAMMQDYAAWARLHPGVRSMRLDMANELHYRFLNRRLLAAGKTAENSPQLFRRMATARTRAIARAQARPAEADDAPPWCAQAISFSEAPKTSGHFAAQSTFSCTGGSAFSFADITAYTMDESRQNLHIVNHGSAEDFAIPLLETEVVPAAIQRVPNQIFFMDSATLAFDDVQDFSGYQPLETAGAVPNRDATLSFTHPKEIQNDASSSDPRLREDVIRMCIYRGSVGAGRDCDYAVVRKEANGSLTPFPSASAADATGLAAAIPNPNGTWVADTAAYFASTGPLTYQNGSAVLAYLPMEGSYDAGAAFGTECANQSTLGSAQLFLAETGGYCDKAQVVGSPTGNVGSVPWTAPDSKQSVWPFRGLVDFGQTCLGVFQNVKMIVTITNPAPACRGARNLSYKFDKIDFRNSCLAEGTLVTLGSGKTVPVEKIAEGDKVVSDDHGRTLTVQAIAHGYEPFPMVRIQDDRGQRVMVTETHPMLKDTGMVVAAKKLVVGDRVMTRRGVTTLVSVERVKFEGRVFNFALGTRDEVAVVGPDRSTLFANGFLVGDNVMQRRLEERSRPSRAQALARLPSEWRADYEHAVARKTVAAQ